MPKPQPPRPIDESTADARPLPPKSFFANLAQRAARQWVVSRLSSPRGFFPAEHRWETLGLETMAPAKDPIKELLIASAILRSGATPEREARVLAALRVAAKRPLSERGTPTYGEQRPTGESPRLAFWASALHSAGSGATFAVAQLAAQLGERGIVRQAMRGNCRTVEELNPWLPLLRSMPETPKEKQLSGHVPVEIWREETLGVVFATSGADPETQNVFLSALEAESIGRGFQAALSLAVAMETSQDLVQRMIDCALRNGRADILGAHFEAKTPFLVAAENAEETTLRRFLPYSDPDAQERDDHQTAIMLLCENAHYEIGNGKTPTQIEDCALFLISCMSPQSLALKDDSGMTALAHAARAGLWRVVNALLDMGLDANTVNSHGQTMLLSTLSGEHEMQIDEATLRRMAQLSDLNARDKKGRGPVSVALLNGDVEALERARLCKLLVDFGADPNARDHEGKTALHLLWHALPGDDSAFLAQKMVALCDSSIRDNQGALAFESAAPVGMLDNSRFVRQVSSISSKFFGRDSLGFERIRASVLREMGFGLRKIGQDQVVSDLFLRCLEQHAWPYCEELADWAPKNLGKSQKKRLEKIPADHTRIRALLESRELQEVLRAAQSATPTAPSAPAKRAANLAQPQPAAAKRPAGASSSETVAHEAYLTASPSAPLGNSDRPTPSRGRRL